MTPIRFKSVVVLLYMLFGCSGCGIIVQNSIDTQPRVELTEESFKKPQTIVGGKAVAYIPLDHNVWRECDPDLIRFAPTIVQGFQFDEQDSKYHYGADAIGTPRLVESGKRIQIDTSRPAVFARVEHANVYNKELKQLTYVFWYPQRPVGAVESGSVDGGILRITLDIHGEPSIFEYSQPCGCFHGTFASRNLEDLAQTEFGSAAPSRAHSLEAPLEKSNWVVRDLIDVREGASPVLYMSAGKHFCEAIRFRDPQAPLNVDQTRNYVLSPYQALESIEGDDGTRHSMFNQQGLVIGGRRWKEEMLFAEMDNPGWPRRLDQMRIHWDHDRWDDPELLETSLRLPHALCGSSAPAQNASAADLQSSRSPLMNEKPRVLFIMNRACLGCKYVKEHVLSVDSIKRALANLKFESVDTATPEGAFLAARHRVDSTPVLLGFDCSDNEVFRSADLENPADVLKLLEKLN